jgi:hypothetical protein
MVNIYFRPTVPQEKFFNLVFHQKKKQVLFCGGIGSAKTSALAFYLLQYVQWCRKPALIMSPTFPTMMDSTLAAFTRFYNKFGVKHRVVGRYFELGTYPPGHPQSSEPIRHYLRTFNHPGHIAGTQPGCVLADEFAQASQEIFIEAIGRLREEGTTRQFLAATTPAGFNHVYDIFEKEKSNSRGAVYCNTESNANNLPADYIENLRNSYSDQVALERLDGKYVPYTGAVYKSIRFIENFKPDPLSPFSISIDFGVQHPAAWLFQKQKVMDINGTVRTREVVFDYVQEENIQTLELCQKIKDRLEFHGFDKKPAIITCDPTGNNQSSRTRFTDVSQVDGFFSTKCAYTWNPRQRSIISGMNLLNRALETGNVVISKDCEFKRRGSYSCPGESLRGAIYKKDGSGEQEKGALARHSDHGCDAARYYLINEYPDYLFGDRVFKEIEC